MTCPLYISGVRRMKGPTVDDVCASWNLDYNMGKILESIRDSVNSDPVSRIEKLKEVGVRVDRAITGIECDMIPVVKQDFRPVDDHKCAMREKPGACAHDGTPCRGSVAEKGDVPGPTPKADITNGPVDVDPVEQIRKVLTKVIDSAGSENGEVADMMGSIMDIMGIRPPEGLDPETIGSMDQMVRDAIDVVRKFKGKNA